MEGLDEVSNALSWDREGLPMKRVGGNSKLTMDKVFIASPTRISHHHMLAVSYRIEAETRSI